MVREIFMKNICILKIYNIKSNYLITKQGGLMVMTSAFHPRGPGSIP